MQEYKIEVKETLSRVISVTANSLDEAVEAVTRQYDNEEITLDYDDYKGYEILPYTD